jgi:hypothetical protein
MKKTTADVKKVQKLSNSNIQSLAKKLAIWAFSLIKHPFSREPGRL